MHTLCTPGSKYQMPNSYKCEQPKKVENGTVWTDRRKGLNIYVDSSSPQCHLFIDFAKNVVKSKHYKYEVSSS